VPRDPVAEPALGHRTVLELDGVRRTVIDWEAATGIPRRSIVTRLLAGWSVERALTEPLDARRQHAGARKRRRSE
jgi:hypothetical protein